MLGGAVAGLLDDDPAFDVAAPGRSEFDAERDDVATLLDEYRPGWVVNTIAVLAALIDERDPASVQRATAVNALFPAALARAAGERGTRVVQSGTDGVFSGRDGPYDEDAEPDAADVYGSTKSLGEAPGEGVLHLRSSVVGTESRGTPRSLLGRVLTLDHGARMTGWTDQRWNGVTARAWARVCAGIVRAGELPPSPLHLVPADSVSRYELLRLIADAFGRQDLRLEPGPGPSPSDRTLTTRHPEAVRRLWQAAGYPGAPTIAAMIAEQAAQAQ
jgi:dTDP-4-dehydrorhamnose reductase